MIRTLPSSLGALVAALSVAACVRPTAPPTPAPAPLPPASIWGDAPSTATPVDAPAETMLVPVAGVHADKIPDSFNEKRDGGRTHRATDILAPRGTPVLAATAGTILKVHHSTLGGNSIYERDGSGNYILYYAHLDRYHAGLFEGQIVAMGDTLGFVGTTGNAPPNIPHLHFQVMRAAPDAKWSEGTPIDVRLWLVDADAIARRSSAAR